MPSPAVDAPKTLDLAKPQKVSYCIDLWRRDLQIAQNTAACPSRLLPTETMRDDSIAVVCYGPTLNDTWEQIGNFQYVMSCSGAHKFLIDRGIVPTWHCDVDPRKHKIALIGEPHADVEYLIASTCHPEYFKLLLAGGFNVKLWHVFDGADEAQRVLPPGEWALTGGCSVGLRALAVARFLGFRSIDVFGMDGNEGPSGKHAAAHPSQAQTHATVEHHGRTFRTTPAFLEAARQTPHEMDDLKDVTARFHGDGLVQAIMRDYVRKPRTEPSMIAFNKVELITPEYRRLNAQLHDDNLAYGVGAGRHADTIKKLIKTLKNEDGLPPSVLDYGCGKGFLQKELPFPIFEYDPAMPGKDTSAKAADLVCCLDVLEHVEPDKLLFVLDDLRRCVKQLGYFVINTGPATKTLADGRNTHLIQQGKAWWEAKLSAFFTVAKIFEVKSELHVLLAPKPKAAKVPKPSITIPSGPRLSFDRLTFRRDPYVIGAASEVLEHALYQALAASFPPLDLFKAFGGGNRKWSLSTVNHPDQYAAFLQRTPLWQAFARYVKDPAFIDKMRLVLKTHGLTPLDVSEPLKARFEFSMLPADGGCLRPHTDLPSKLVTLVVSMLPRLADWDPAWGGGTDVLVPKGDVALVDYKAEFEAFDVVATYPYVPNQCVVFVKTADSWHGVGPMRGICVEPPPFRSTLTINIERAS